MYKFLRYVYICKFNDGNLCSNPAYLYLFVWQSAILSSFNSFVTSHLPKTNTHKSHAGDLINKPKVFTSNGNFKGIATFYTRLQIQPI